MVALIEWLPDLTKTTMPYILLNKLKEQNSQTTPINGIELEKLASNEHEGLDETVLADLVQWSDLIMFDYLTGNKDRVASMQVSGVSYNLYLEHYPNHTISSISYNIFFINYRMALIRKNDPPYSMKLFIILQKAQRQNHCGY